MNNPKEPTLRDLVTRALNPELSVWLAWTAEPPTVPGHYLCAYRFSSHDWWTHVQMHLTPEKLPVKVDTSDTRWFGPIPQLKD